MFCEKCGAKIENGANFCTSCGNEVLKVLINDVPDSDEVYIDSPMKGAVTQVVCEDVDTEALFKENTADEVCETGVAVNDVHMEQNIKASDVYNIKKPAKKKNKGLIIGLAAGIIGVLLSMAVVFGFLVKDTVFFAVSPEKYTGKLISNTIEQLTDEAEVVNENLLGFMLKADDAYTMETKVEIDEEYAKGTEIEVVCNMANDPENEEMLLDIDISGKKEDGRFSAQMQGFWDNEKIGLAADKVKYDGDDVLPEEVADKYFVVSSRNFGDDYMNSVFVDKEAGYYNEYGDISGLDLSYTNIMGLFDEENLKPLKKEINKKFIVLLENSDISDRESVKYHFKGDEVRAKKITVMFNSEALADFAIGALEAVKDDHFMRKQLGAKGINEINLKISDLKDNRSNIVNSTLPVDFIEYDDRIIEISASYNGDSLVISTTDKDYILNGIKFKSYSYENVQNEFEYASNWVNENNEIFVNLKALEYGSVTVEADVNFDFGRGKFKAAVKIPGVDVREISGKCSKDDGFSVSVDEMRISKSGHIKTNSMEYDDWFDKNYRNTDEKAYSYYTDNENYDELWDIYFDEFLADYDSYAEWYDAMGQIYDETYKSYDKWLDDEIYDSKDIKDSYDYETGNYEYVDYDVNINAVFTIRDEADVSIRDRKHINIFRLSEDDIVMLKEIFEEIESI